MGRSSVDRDEPAAVVCALGLIVGSTPTTTPTTTSVMTNVSRAFLLRSSPRTVASPGTLMSNVPTPLKPDWREFRESLPRVSRIASDG